jgi:undecaprenyl diphosphate synthase
MLAVSSKSEYARFDMNEHGVKHLAIIMDGNRRWAKEQGLPSFEGHRRGYEKMKHVGDWCLDRGIEIMTVYAFSNENWKRTEEEVGFLMDLLELALDKELDFFKQRGIRLRVIGRREKLRPSVLRAIDRAQAETAMNTRATLCLCLNYGGRLELVDVCKAIVNEGLSPDQITEEAVSHHLYWPDMPDPDLIIRTSGEERLSNFLTWQSVYSELFWCKHHWPAFTEEYLDEALQTFMERQRRYGQ